MRLRNKKTGEIIEGKCFTDIVKKLHDSGDPICSGPLLSIALFEQYWEEIDEYKPTEPLIKDEKIRKAVRAWADGNNIESVHYDAFWRGFRRDNSSITVWEELPLENNKVYTIAELCGEEEE